MLSSLVKSCYKKKKKSSDLDSVFSKMFDLHSSLGLSNKRSWTSSSMETTFFSSFILEQELFSSTLCLTPILSALLDGAS